MKVRAAICWEPQKPLQIDEVNLDGPQTGECLVRLVATGVCHTDAYTMSGPRSVWTLPGPCSDTKVGESSRRSAPA